MSEILTPNRPTVFLDSPTTPVEVARRLMRVGADQDPNTVVDLLLIHKDELAFPNWGGLTIYPDGSLCLGNRHEILTKHPARLLMISASNPDIPITFRQFGQGLYEDPEAKHKNIAAHAGAVASALRRVIGSDEDGIPFVSVRGYGYKFLSAPLSHEFSVAS